MRPEPSKPGLRSSLIDNSPETAWCAEAINRIDSQMASLVWEYESLDVPAARVPLRVPKHWFFTFTAFLRHFRRNSPALCLLSTYLGMMWPNIVFLRPGIRIKSTLDTIIGWKRWSTGLYVRVRPGSRSRVRLTLWQPAFLVHDAHIV